MALFTAKKRSLKWQLPLCSIHRQPNLERSFRGRSLFRTWLFGIAIHRLIDANRSQKRAREALKTELGSLSTIEPGPSPGVRIDDARLQHTLMTCLSQLDASTQNAILLRYFGELGWAEVAELCGDDTDAMRMRVSRARIHLRRCIEAKLGQQ